MRSLEPNKGLVVAGKIMPARTPEPTCRNYGRSPDSQRIRKGDVRQKHNRSRKGYLLLQTGKGQSPLNLKRNKM